MVVLELKEEQGEEGLQGPTRCMSNEGVSSTLHNLALLLPRFPRLEALEVCLFQEVHPDVSFVNGTFVVGAYPGRDFDPEVT